jgi:hypothetical protein
MKLCRIIVLAKIPFWRDLVLGKSQGLAGLLDLGRTTRFALCSHKAVCLHGLARGPRSDSKELAKTEEREAESIKR